MEDLFAPVLKDILRLLSDQYDKALRKGKRIGVSWTSLERFKKPLQLEQK